MDRQKISFGIGKRLKELRKSKGLSRQKLADTLCERYEIRISEDSLRDYEIDNNNESKSSKLPNMGMRLEYLYCLADFYNVSTDYLLGLTPFSSVDISVRAICEYTGLDEYSVSKLHSLSASAVNPNEIIEFINSLLCGRDDRDEKYLDKIGESIRHAAWAEANSAREDRENLDIDVYFKLDGKERTLVMQKISEKSALQQRQTMDAIFNGESMVPIPANDVARLYTETAKDLVGFIVEDTIGIFENKFESQLLALKNKK